MKKTLNTLFIVIAVLAILEYVWIFGAFTGPIILLCAAVISIANVIYAAVNRDYHDAALYAIAGIALCMGYLKAML